VSPSPSSARQHANDQQASINKVLLTDALHMLYMLYLCFPNLGLTTGATQLLNSRHSGPPGEPR
jgi:hypothetical protein